MANTARPRDTSAAFMASGPRATRHFSISAVRFSGVARIVPQTSFNLASTCPSADWARRPTVNAERSPRGTVPAAIASSSDIVQSGRDTSAAIAACRDASERPR